MNTRTPQEYRKQINARFDRLLERYGEAAESVLWDVSGMPRGIDADVDALRELRSIGRFQITSELKRIGAHGEVLAAPDFRRGAPFRILLIRAGHGYAFVNEIDRMLRRLKKLPSNIGVEALWNALPKNKNYWRLEIMDEDF